MCLICLLCVTDLLALCLSSTCSKKYSLFSCLSVRACWCSGYIGEACKNCLALAFDLCPRALTIELFNFQFFVRFPPPYPGVQAHSSQATYPPAYLLSSYLATPPGIHAHSPQATYPPAHLLSSHLATKKIVPLSMESGGWKLG